MNSQFAIRAEGLGKRYRRGTHQMEHNTLRDLLSESVRALVWRNGTAAATETFWALRDASFEVGQGESVGIVGLNGAGKSTLLKLLSRITAPTSGRAVIAGRVGALLEVGTGFHWELTGRENIYLYSAILGMSRDEVRGKFDEIVAFSGIGEFIDTPVKRYSSGMYVRLAFSVAAHLQPDILLLDEVLSVGDITFQRRCAEFAKRLQQSQATILFVSHNMFSIKMMCNRVIYLKEGRIIFDGPTDEGIRLYEEDCRLAALPTEEPPQDWPLCISDVAICDQHGVAKSVFDHGERLRLRLHCEIRRPLSDPNVMIALVRSDGVACCNFSSEADGFFLGNARGEATIEVLTPPLKLVAEAYTVQILVREKGFGRLLCAQAGGVFHVRHELFDTHFGVFHEAASWSSDTERASSASAASGLTLMR
jgi:lipopolysaccharide transport system ATP-binding protein